MSSLFDAVMSPTEPTEMDPPVVPGKLYVRSSYFYNLSIECTYRRPFRAYFVEAPKPVDVATLSDI